MPELPEVTHITDVLRDKLLGSNVKGLLIHKSSRYCKDGILSLEIELDVTPVKQDTDYFYELSGKVIDVFNYGKKIFIKLDEGYYIALFLAVFGTLRFDKSENAKQTIIFSTSNLYFHDSNLNWGIFSIVKDYKTILKNIGPSFFSEEGTLEYFRKCIKSGNKMKKPRGWENKTIGWFLLQQIYLSGVGTYIRSESLFRSKINPWELLIDMSDDQIDLLYYNIKNIMTESYNKGGYSFRDYVDPNGVKGTFQTLIVDKNFDPDGNKVERTKLADRNIDFVPTIQTIK